MLITITGTDDSIFTNAFFDSYGDVAYVDFLSVSSTEATLLNLDTGAITSFTGTGFDFSETGDPNSGTITSISFSFDNIVQGTFENIDWDVVAFFESLFALEDNNYQPLVDLFDQSDTIEYDASDATAGTEFNGIEGLIGRPIDFTGSAFADTVSGTGAKDKLLGGAGDDDLYGGGGSDTLKGGTGEDYLVGGNGKDKLNGGGGDDVLKGNGGKDKLNGGGGDDTLKGGSGNDTLKGGGGDDNLKGGGGRDNLKGGGGNDTLKGGGGNDKLNGGKGDDMLFGGGGGDVFVFSGTFGADVISDFSTDKENEDIDLSAISAIADYDDLTSNHLSQSGANAVIEDGNGNTITLLNTDINDLDSSDFIF